MSKDILALPETRSWRQIPQQVGPRAMSSEGRRRVAWGALRFTMGAVAIVLVGWGGWQVAASLGENQALMPDAAKGDRVRNLVLVTDGVLDRNWLARRLAIPADATLMGLDLATLRRTVLGDPQVSTAAITRNFPDTLTVHISERSPVVRMMAQSGTDAPSMLLVSRDGVAFAGTGFDASMVSTLPWLQGVRLSRTAGSLAPIEGMKAVSDLLATAKLEADTLYRKWQVVSLARLASDGEIEIHTKDGLTVIFGTTEDYLRQIGRLDLLVDASGDPTRPLREVNLALGSQVPVAYGIAAPTIGGPPVNALGTEPAKPLIASPLFTNLHIDSHREL